MSGDSDLGMSGPPGAGATTVTPSWLFPLVREEYALEYGRDKLELHRDAIHPDDRVLIIDDVLATGGTAAATTRLVETLGGRIIGFGALLEVVGLGGREALAPRRVEVLASY